MQILLVEDDFELAKRIQEALSINSYKTTICITYKQALNEIKKPLIVIYWMFIYLMEVV